MLACFLKALGTPQFCPCFPFPQSIRILLQPDLTAAEEAQLHHQHSGGEGSAKA